MKDEEFQKKLEGILETFYKIDREVREYIYRERYCSMPDPNSYGIFRSDDLAPVQDYKHKKDHGK